MSSRWDAVVVGGGVAGLVAARELAHAGLRVVVLEGRDAPGGAVRGHTVAGLRLDAGAESFATRGGVVSAYLDELGLTDRVRLPAPHGSWVHLPSGDGPLPRTGLLGIPSQPWSRDVRRTIGLVGSLRASLDLVLPTRAGAPTLGALVRARMGARVLDRLVRPVVGGVHAADPDDLPVGAVAPGLPAALEGARGSLARAVRSLRATAPAGSAVQGLDGGLHVLVGALVADVEAHGGEVRTRSVVTSVRRASAAPARTTALPGATDASGAVDASDPVADEASPRTTDEDDLTPAGEGTPRTTDEGGTAAAYEVVVGEETLRTPRLVVAAPVAADLLAPLVAEPGSFALDPGAAVTLVTLVVDASALDAAPRGTGVLVAREAHDVTAKALTHGTAKWPWLAAAAGDGRHVVRLSYGRAGEEDAVPSDRAELVELARRDASVLLGVPLPASAVRGHAVVRWTQALPRPSAAHQEAVAALRAAASTLPGVAVCGAWVAGNGIAAVVPQARDAARSLV
ncbi:protoporphyrinogen/coproporphyrinogen oxidase [Cellulomonas fimi]|uniref:Protoporphyrinogen oxidase n=1 Tax=Cellulomonas fimi (strain ATCC 484 / DSM 20113 / JCM 1341 / CCUG 24087 / LMG 16345 / NBRC 15513 / NCIMB 8980 / NCTC 7547 / NRS-133) TaxID=590998 RepID=F4H672_CELFA|nr:FAD-dependent oxidoreductase [Cellulomonas fimi]AEE44384.1 protoporphyrinogen oxidase [Cellulomonas fimi ATCC 484]VEH26252.1 Protoporphyrinogen oxidase [Cellulomonas fimi]